MNSFDYIVIGAGSAGCVVAGRLSESQTASICVVEAGPRDNNPFIHIPAGVVRTMFNPRLSWCYKTEPTEATMFRAINQPRGKTLGGSGAINGHIYNRGSRADYDGWKARGNTGWGYDDVLAYFRRSERRITAGETEDSQYRGSGGPFAITDPDQKEPLCDAFIAAANALGIPENADYNGADQYGIAYAQRSVHRGRRVSPARAFLRPAEKRGNTHVICDAHVTAIEFKDRRAVAVTLRRADGSHDRIEARREIILSGGAIASPQILQLSGVGDTEHIKALGIETVLHNRAVGENLRDHYACRVTARVDGDSINTRVHGLNLVGQVARYLVARRGALTLTPTLLYAFLKSAPDVDSPDIQLTFTPASYPEGVQAVLDRFPGATIACWVQRPKSVGFVRIASADPIDHPVIQPNYLTDPNDRDLLLKALRISRQIIVTPPFSNRVVNETKPGLSVQSDEDVMAYARATGHSAFHPMGTCRMGPETDKTTVVDARLRVHGLGGLRVADASIMPDMISANTNAAALMIGEKAADMILEDARRA